MNQEKNEESMLKNFKITEVSVLLDKAQNSIVRAVARICLNNLIEINNITLIIYNKEYDIIMPYMESNSMFIPMINLKDAKLKEAILNAIVKEYEDQMYWIYL